MKQQLVVSGRLLYSQDESLQLIRYPDENTDLNCQKTHKTTKLPLQQTHKNKYINNLYAGWHKTQLTKNEKSMYLAPLHPLYQSYMNPISLYNGLFFF